MAQAVSHWPFDTDAWVQSKAIPCGICVGQSGTVAGFAVSTLVFQREYHSTDATCSIPL